MLLSLIKAGAEPSLSGPTVLLSYDDTTAIRNPIETFMYFIPLTSPVRVYIEKSEPNGQKAWITSYQLRKRKDTFRLRCEFTIAGDGYYINVFNHQDIIAYNTSFLSKPTTITNLDYMRFEGNGYGALEIEGYLDGNTPAISRLSIDFSEEKTRSPVMIGLYSIEPEGEEYEYDKRSHFVKARVDSIIFQNPTPGTPPKMQLKLSTYGSENSADGFASSIKAIIANLLVEPIYVNPAGNKALLEFAKAIYLKQDHYVFPEIERIILMDRISD